MKKGKVIALIVLFIFLGATVFGVSRVLKNPEKYQKSSNVDIIFDATKYSYISKNDLLEKLGQPNEIHEDIYTYNEMEFTIKNDIVTKLKYLPNNSISYKIKNDIFYMFGINPNKNTIKKVVDTNTTYKFQSVSNGIWEFEIYGLNEKEHTFDIVIISYQK